MLSIEEFTSGRLGDAVPLALMLPRTKYEEPILVGRAGQDRVAVFLGEKHMFHSFKYETNDYYSGLIINDVTIEVDEASAFDPDVTNSPLGSLIRQESNLCIYSVVDRNFPRTHAIPLIENLDALSVRHSVGFLRWQIVLGRGIEKRVLRTIDIANRASP